VEDLGREENQVTVRKREEQPRMRIAVPSEGPVIG
jgi:hypothetical protein